MNEREIFAEAMQKPSAGERAAWLNQACGSDQALRRRIEDLIAEQERLGSFLELPATGVVQVAAATMDAEPVQPVGSQLGPYKLLQVIGEGGMGVVYMAEQHQPVLRRVALKIIKPGMDTRQVIARFEAERQALAMMDHPNIAKVLDAGATPTGRPYFVMELVRGVPISQYCDQQHLTPRQRLELFVPVCQAIQHAHQKGIIHRDLKPSNVLIALYDGQPVPKVIDFGVAKATSQRLTEKTMFTEFGQIVGTLEYMSPEQAELSQLDIDTRSDIYSLGVMLYELLTGTTLFEKQRLRSAAFHEILRMIREEEPPRPSTRLSTTDQLPSIAANRGTPPAKLSSLVRGELDWIVMKSLEKDRGRRYETASGLARDIERYLHDEPVQACPPSTAYVLRKYIGRHQGLVAAASLLLLVMLLGAIGTTAGLIQAAWERSAKETADKNATVSERLAKEAQKATAVAQHAEKQAVGLLARAQAAEHESQIREHLSKARTFRLSGRPGQRFQCLKELAAASKRQPSPGLRDELRDEAIAALCLPDLRPAIVLPGFPVGRDPVFDARFERFADLEADGSIVVRETKGNRELLRLPPAQPPWVSREFSPDRQTFLATQEGTPQGTITRSWNISQRREGPQFVGGLIGLNADSRWLACWVSMADGEVRRYELATGRQDGVVRVGAGFHSFAYHPAGQQIAASYGVTQIWDFAHGTAQSGNGLEQFWVGKWTGSGQFLVGVSSDERLRVWDAGKSRIQSRLEPVRAVTDKFSFHSSGALLATNGWDERLRLWHPLVGRKLLEDVGGEARFSDDGRLLGYSRYGSELVIWEVETAEGYCRVMAQPFDEGPAVGVAWNENGRLLATSTPGGIRLWDAHHGEEVAFAPGILGQARFDLADDSLIVPGPGGLQRWPLQWGAKESELRKLVIGPPKPLVEGAKLNIVSLARTCRRGIAWRHHELPNLTVFDAQKPDSLLTIEAPAGINAALSPNGRWVVVAPFASPPDTTTKIFDASSGKLVHEFTLEDVSYRWVTVAFSGDSRWLATSTANELRLWETDSWRPGSQRARVGSVWPGLVAFNHDGSMLAYSGAPQRIELIEPTTGRTLAKITPPMGWSAGYMEFSPDGTRLAAGAQDHALVIFDLRHIRESLAQMDLDWDPPLPPSTTSPGQRLQVSLELAGVDETELTAPDQLRPTGK